MIMCPEPDAVQAVCTHCGVDLGGRLFVRRGQQYCCEGCYLQATPLAAPVGGKDLHGRFAEALAQTLDLREHETGLHSKRVACHTLVLARRFTADAGRLRQIYWGALLHDIGKIGIPDRILMKRGSLSQADWAVMRGHPEAGYRLVAALPGLEEAAGIVLAHEERFDGSGYPQGLRGEAIPFGARLFAVIDTLDAMTSDRPYRQALDFGAAKQEIVAMAGRQFDPVAVDAFVAEEATLREMVTLKCGPEGFAAAGAGSHG